MQYSKYSLASFTLIYVSGIILGMVIAISQVFSTEILLLAGLSHLLILVILGFFFVPLPLKEEAGNRIQTAGYLHTLIGFASALILLGSTTFDQGDLNEILYPLGSALSTSIVGWLLGGEISSLGENYEKKLVRSEFQQLIEEIQEFTGAIQEIHSNYLSTMTQVYRSYRQLEDEQENLLKKHQTIQYQIMEETQNFHQQLLQTNTQASEEINQLFAQSTERLQALETLFSRTTEEMKKLEPILDSFSQLKTNSDLATTNLSEVAQAARRTAQYLNESRTLMTELENLLEYITSVKNS
jgi:methyl-accepting chemotaxis protein